MREGPPLTPEEVARMKPHERDQGGWWEYGKDPYGSDKVWRPAPKGGELPHAPADDVPVMLSPGMVILVSDDGTMMGPYEVADVQPNPTDDLDTEAVTVTLNTRRSQA